MIEGRFDEARRLFQQMSEDPETRELGLRGLHVEATRLGAHEAARQYAETAAESAPYPSLGGEIDTGTPLSRWPLGRCDPAARPAARCPCAEARGS